MKARLDQVVVDAQDPRKLARFWAQLFGGTAVDRARGWSHVEPAGFPRLAFQSGAPEKEVKNRLHLDIEVDDITACVATAEQLGAEHFGSTVTTELGSYQVMHDPEGNEFCFVHD
jgi:predicted enzyme related to lactoylglutathione lyase